MTATAPKNGHVSKEDVIAALTPHSVETIYQRIGVQQHKSAGGQWRQSRSPFRDDSPDNPSFNFNLETGGWRDHATDETGDIFNAVMHAENCSFPQAVATIAEIVGVTPKPTATSKTGTILKAYDYVDENGTLLSQTVRFHDKRFSQRQPRPGGGWIKNLQGVRRVPYRLPELLAADPTADVLLLEGEKDVDRAIAEGFVATTNAMGAGNWPNDLNIYLADRHVVLIPDNDEAGRDHVAKVARGLPGIVETTKITPLPDLPVKGDFSDWFDAGGTADELRRLIAQTPEWRPEPAATNNGVTPASVEPHEPRVFANTDTGNAERLVALHGSKIRFNWGRNVWLVWSGKHWQLDTSGRMEQLAKATVRAMLDEAKGLEGEHYTKLLKWAASSESAGKRAAMVELARSEDGIPVQPRDLDANPWLLNVSNGTLDLTTGTLRPHNRADLITRLIDTPYDTNATCPAFLAFLTYIFNGNQALIDYVQRMVGYSLTGSIREQIVLIAYGQGSNGKSTLLGILRRLFGDYACEADAESFMEKKGDAIREDIAALEGARLVVASETGDSKRLSEALVKKLTGGEHLRARRLYENGYEFMPQFKVWLSSNHRPEIQGTEHAIWRRIRLVPFDVTIPEDTRDKDFPAKLEAELPGILAWAVRGCIAWQRDGETPPATVLQATAAYRRDMDIIGNWLDDRCDLRPGVRETPKALYDDYVSYCEASGETPIKQRTFGMKLRDRGCGEEKSNGQRYRTGIRLRDPHHHEQATRETGSQGTQGSNVSGNSSGNASTRDLPESYDPYDPYDPAKHTPSDEFVEVEI